MVNKRKKIFVTPNKGEWKVDGISNTFKTRKEAVEAGSRIGRKCGNAELLVKKKDGTIVEKRQYGNDPFPSSK